MFNKFNKEYLELARIAYGGELYFELKNYRLKEIEGTSRIKKISDILLKKYGNENFFSYKNEESGFCANVFENIKNKKLVIAYRGTERTGFGENHSDFVVWGKDISTDINLVTGIVDEQITDAWEFYKSVREQNPKAKINIIGHSLGGALAQLVAARAYNETIDQWQSEKIKTYTYNAPGSKHLLKSFNCRENLGYSFIKNYAIMNDWCGMFGENIGETYLIAPIPLNELSSGSISEALNNILLTTHEGIFNYCEKNNGKIIWKPDDFNQSEGLSLWYYDKNNTLKNVKTLQHILETLKTNFHIQTIKELGQTIKEDTQKFLEKHNINLRDIKNPLKPDNMEEKLLENNSHVFKSLITLMDKSIERVSAQSLKNAIKVLERKKILKNGEDYISHFLEEM